MRVFVATHANAIGVFLILTFLVVYGTALLRNRDFREDQKRWMRFEDMFGINLWINHRWLSAFTIAWFGLFFWVVSLADG